MKDAVIARYEKCPACADGSCRACGAASSDHAAPGVRLVIRRVRFIPCTCDGGCAKCGKNAHEMASPGVTVEIADEHSRKRWVPSMHLLAATNPDATRKAMCGVAHVPEAQLTTQRSEVTCARCKKWG